MFFNIFNAQKNNYLNTKNQLLTLKSFNRIILILVKTKKVHDYFGFYYIKINFVYRISRV